MVEHPSLDTVYEWGRTAPQELLGYADALDTKALTLFVAASVIIGVTAALSPNPPKDGLGDSP